MRLDQMKGFSYPTLAIWPQPKPEFGDVWQMHEYKLTEDEKLAWFPRYVETENKHVRLDIYNTYEDAVAVAKEQNPKLILQLNSIGLNESKQESLRLKVEKAVMSKGRLQSEERLMLQEAIRSHKTANDISDSELVLPERFESLRMPLITQLKETLYIRIAGFPKNRIILIRDGESDWSKTGTFNQKTAKYCYRERIAAGFGLSATDHWGKTKAKIRSLLLPRANQLLQLASVKRMLDQARREGQQVLLAGGFVFWYEENGGVGWVVKEASESGAGVKGNTLWEQGKIISKNHGRIVVFPYIKENGECVQGHTKNSPNDGKALPRHPNEYLQLPFKILEDDLLIGLFGELKYE